jgi:CRISPR-associated endonuclease/helicase Cas3
MSYNEFFFKATGVSPFDFQKRLRHSEARTTVLKAPTGLGKTDSVLVAWLHWRVSEPATTPRRLVWCLPGRALTEQVASVAEERVQRLVEAGLMQQPIKVYRLMGGSADNAAKLGPDEAAILVGTQDILLSRALNRGYARKPFRWPIDFALLNNDCFWVMDEVQLLGDGLATSTQLAALRERFGVFGSAPSCWISATIDPAWMETVDFAGGADSVIELEDEDRKNDIVRMRWNAQKAVERAPASCRMPLGVAEFVAERHAAGTLTLVIANTVRRAVEIRMALEKMTAADVRLLHSRFRAADRKQHVAAALDKVIPEAGRIVVATQVIEAGIDIDSTLMVSDLAPYASMVQRFGRVNRKGEHAGCAICWVDRPLVAKQKMLAEAEQLSEKDQEKVCAPYDPAEVAAAGQILAGMNSAAPADLPKLVSSPAPWKHVLRRADILDLFDTSADLGGNDIDISRFVRSDREKDVYVFWRQWEGKDTPPPVKIAEIDDGELCPAPLWDVSPKAAWAWNSVEGVWVRPESIYPGMTLLLHVSEGKYTEDFGWQTESRETVKVLEPGDRAIEPNDDDSKSYGRYRQTLKGHTDQVCAEMQRLIEALPGIGLEPHHAALEAAARFHDWGKAHPVMQKTLQGCEPPYTELLAKSAGNGRHSVRFFRHELASALAMIGAGESDLSAYVAAAHHGRIRVVVRSMPGERIAGRTTRRVRGIEDGEQLMACSLGGGVELTETAVRLEAAKLGSELDGAASWTDRALRLRDELGPFRLAYLEMLLRVADEAASARAAEEAKV